MIFNLQSQQHDRASGPGNRFGFNVEAAPADIPYPVALGATAIPVKRDQAISGLTGCSTPVRVRLYRSCEWSSHIGSNRFRLSESERNRAPEFNSLLSFQ
jgi:hypothetical protein